MNRSVILGALMVGLLVVGLSVMASKTLTPAANGIRVVTSFYPLGYLAASIVGELGTVTTITPAGVEPHDYQPTAGDLAAIEQSHLLVLNGAGLEPWSDRVTRQLKGSDVHIVVASQGLTNTTSIDPHVWLDPLRAKAEAQAIADQLIVIDAAHASTYRANLTQLSQELDRIDLAYRTGLATCRTRQLVTAHVAFAYLADRYGLTQLGIAGLSPDEEPSPEQLATVATFVRDHHTTTIFFETLVSPKLADTIARETGATTAELNPIEGLTDRDFAAGNDYRSLMLQNLTELQKALQCQA